MRKKDIFYYTKRKIIIISITIVFLCLFIFASITQFLYSSRLFNNIDKQLLNQKNIILSLAPLPFDERMFDENKLPFASEPILQSPPPIMPNLIAAIYLGNKLQFITPNSYFTAENPPAVFNNTDGSIQNKQYDGYNFRGVSFLQGKYTIELLVNVDSELKSIKQLSNSIILGLIVLIIIALLLSAFLASKIIKPVKDAYDKQVYFVQDASHEMRTPLAVIKGKLEILANSWGETIDDNFEHISKIMSEVRSLEKLNNDLLLLSKEDIDSSITITEFKLLEFIDDISDFYTDLAELQSKTFNIIRPEADITVKWDYDKIKRLAVILLENAFKYTPEKGLITLSFEDLGKHIRVTVRDTGIGIKEEDQSRIFDRFFRSSDVRAQNINGSGIGLSLLKSISKTFGISINFTSKHGEGAEFKLLLPKTMKNFYRGI